MARKKTSDTTRKNAPRSSEIMTIHLTITGVGWRGNIRSSCYDGMLFPEDHHRVAVSLLFCNIFLGNSFTADNAVIVAR
jgi:hypothetical protein